MKVTVKASEFRHIVQIDVARLKRYEIQAVEQSSQHVSVR